MTRFISDSAGQDYYHLAPQPSFIFKYLIPYIIRTNFILCSYPHFILYYTQTNLSFSPTYLFKLPAAQDSSKMLRILRVFSCVNEGH